ncbi:MAG: AMP-binding protein [bacterium]|nr:AMP-binding protein [bacterium]
MSPSTLPLFDRARSHGDRVAIRDLGGDRFTYRDLLEAASRVAAALLDGRAHLAGERVAFLVPPSFAHVAVQWGIWRAGGIAVPIALAHPPPEIDTTLEDSAAAIVVATRELEDRVRPLAESRGLRRLSTAEALAPTVETLAADPVAPPPLDVAQPATILYTSGTTGKPKGVVLTHRNLQAQIESLVAAWQWRRDDDIPGILPLHHVHGIVNILTCALWSGAACEMFPRFDAEELWEHLLGGRPTLMMAVPTIYRRLIAVWEEAEPSRREAMSRAAARLRLMVSGSAALPVPVLERWREITGQVLLERYGMTEIGMALANPLEGRRVPGAVGSPLPGVEVQLVDEAGRRLGDGVAGEIEVRGASVFQEYWRRPDATREAFRDGWFRTGDVAVREQGIYRILGRRSVDIIKTGGEKVSALEIEAVLRAHPAIDDCAVVGVEDPEWGERVSAALVCRPGMDLELAALRSWARDRLAVYKIPSRILRLDELPRNAMGKVTKPRVAELLRAAAGNPTEPLDRRPPAG